MVGRRATGGSGSDGKAYSRAGGEEDEDKLECRDVGHIDEMHWDRHSRGDLLANAADDGISRAEDV